MAPSVTIKGQLAPYHTKTSGNFEETAEYAVKTDTITRKENAYTIGLHTVLIQK